MSKVIEHPALKAMRARWFWMGALFALCCAGCPAYYFGNISGDRSCTEDVCTEICQQMHGEKATGETDVRGVSTSCRCLIEPEPIISLLLQE